MLHWSSRVKSVLILNMAYFLTLFLYLDREKKKVESLKIKNFDQTSEKSRPPNSGKF